jgi:hypothetical protein
VKQHALVNLTFFVVIPVSCVHVGLNFSTSLRANSQLQCSLEVILHKLVASDCSFNRARHLEVKIAGLSGVKLIRS